MKYYGKSTKTGRLDICGYELSTNLQNFTQKDLTEMKIFISFRSTFFETPVHITMIRGKLGNGKVGNGKLGNRKIRQR